MYPCSFNELTFQWSVVWVFITLHLFRFYFYFTIISFVSINSIYLHYKFALFSSVYCEFVQFPNEIANLLVSKKRQIRKSQLSFKPWSDQDSLHWTRCECMCVMRGKCMWMRSRKKNTTNKQFGQRRKRRRTFLWVNPLHLA